MFTIDVISQIMAFPLVWLALTLARWEPTTQATAEWWLFAVVLYRGVRIIQVAIFVQQHKGTPHIMPAQADDDFFEEYPEFAGDKSTNRMTILGHAGQRNWSLLWNTFLVQFPLTVFRGLPYVPIGALIAFGANQANRWAQMPNALLLVFAVALWTSLWVTYVSVFERTFTRIDQKMEFLFWSIWPW